MRKPRILLISEFHKLNSGYATYGNELLTRLHNSGKYEVFEFAQYGDGADPSTHSSPWKVYPNLPLGLSQKRANEQEVQEYLSSPFNEFGAWKFEEVCLDCQPDICAVFEDWWYFEYQERSPFRRLYNWVIQPAVDSIPQSEQWLATFKNADRVLTYTDWGASQLRKEGGGLINVVGAASPGVDLDTFKPVINKLSHKEKFGFDKDSLIVGFVNRNQKRKLIPDLVAAFSEFIKAAPKDLADRTILYLSTSYPDIGWDIPRLIKKSGVANKIYFTYYCPQCTLVVPQNYKDAVNICPRCNTYGMRLPGTHVGLNRNQLADIYNLFDVYVQYANSEGLGMAQPEAAACGVPIFATDYSGMHDVLEKLNGTPIKVLKLLTEAETGCQRAIPDDTDFIAKLIKFLSLPESIKNKKRMEVRQLAVKHYGWNDNAAKWMSVFDSIDINTVNQWAAPPRIHQPVQNYPGAHEMPDDQFVGWAIVNVLGRPDLLDSYLSLRLLRDLLTGATETQGGFYHNDMSTLGMRPQYRAFGREELIKELSIIAEKNNKWEMRRWSMAQSGAFNGY